MELRERKRTASLGSPKIAPKADKEWQTQLDIMEKRMTENIEKRILEKSQEIQTKVMENINKMNEKLVDEIKTLMVSELKEVRKDVAVRKTDMKGIQKKQETEARFRFRSTD